MGPVIHDQGSTTTFLEYTLEQAVQQRIVRKDARAADDINGKDPFGEMNGGTHLIVLHLDELHRALHSNLKGTGAAAKRARANAEIQLLGVVENNSDRVTHP
jgi:hypothetical protein